MTMPMIAPNNTETNKTEYTKKAPVYNAINPNSIMAQLSRQKFDVFIMN